MEDRSLGLDCPLRWLGSSDADSQTAFVTRATKYHNMGSLEPQKLIVSQFWGPEVKIKLWAGHTPSGGAREGSVPGLSPCFWELQVFLGLEMSVFS